MSFLMFILTVPLTVETLGVCQWLMDVRAQPQELPLAIKSLAWRLLVWALLLWIFYPAAWTGLYWGVCFAFMGYLAGFYLPRIIARFSRFIPDVITTQSSGVHDSGKKNPGDNGIGEGRGNYRRGI